jgi:hypothetical protein
MDITNIDKHLINHSCTDNNIKNLIHLSINKKEVKNNSSRLNNLSKLYDHKNCNTRYIDDNKNNVVSFDIVQVNTKKKNKKNNLQSESLENYLECFGNY